MHNTFLSSFFHTGLQATACWCWRAVTGWEGASTAPPLLFPTATSTSGRCGKWPSAGWRGGDCWCALACLRDVCCHAVAWSCCVAQDSRRHCWPQPAVRPGGQPGAEGVAPSRLWQQCVDGRGGGRGCSGLEGTAAQLTRAHMPAHPADALSSVAQRLPHPQLPPSPTPASAPTAPALAACLAPGTASCSRRWHACGARLPLTTARLLMCMVSAGLGGRVVRSMC